MSADGRDRFDCTDCGEGVGVDEDGCCTTCGQDAEAVYSSPLVAARAEVSRLRAALEEIAAMGCQNSAWFDDIEDATCITQGFAAYRRCPPCRARAALDVTRG